MNVSESIRIDSERRHEYARKLTPWTGEGNDRVFVLYGIPNLEELTGLHAKFVSVISGSSIKFNFTEFPKSLIQWMVDEFDTTFHVTVSGQPYQICVPKNTPWNAYFKNLPSRRYVTGDLVIYDTEMCISSHYHLQGRVGTVVEVLDDNMYRVRLGQVEWEPESKIYVQTTHKFLRPYKKLDAVDIESDNKDESRNPAAAGRAAGGSAAAGPAAGGKRPRLEN